MHHDEFKQRHRQEPHLGAWLIYSALERIADEIHAHGSVPGPNAEDQAALDSLLAQSADFTAKLENLAK